MYNLSFFRHRYRYFSPWVRYLNGARLKNGFVSLLCQALRLKHSSQFPPVLIVRPTAKCNYSCIMCQKSSAEDTMYQHPESLNFERLAAFLREAGRYISVVKLHGGEPLFYKNIHSLLALLNDCQIPYTIITNGYLLTPEIIMKVVKRCLEISFSIDAVEPDLYKFIRRGGNIEKVTSNIRCLNKLKLESGSNTPILNLAMTVFSYNLKEMPKIIKYCHENAINSITFGEGVSYNTPLIKEEHLLRNHVSLTQKYRNKAEALGQELGLFTRFNLPSLNKVQNHQEESKRRNKTKKTCPDLYSASEIYPNGDIYPCCHAKEPLGHFNQLDFRQVWNDNNSKYSEARQQFRKGKIPDACKGCKLI